MSITSEYEQSKITTIIAETGEHFYLGARFNPDNQMWGWVSGDQWTYSHWGSGEPDTDDDDGNGLCAYMHRHEEIGYWRAVSCDDKFSYICESPRLGYTEPPTTTTTQPPVLYCPSTYAMHLNGHCYEWFAIAESDDGFGFNFEGGRAFCKAQFGGGDLVSFGDMEEENIFYETMYIPDGDYWIGYAEDQQVSQVKNN